MAAEPYLGSVIQDQVAGEDETAHDVDMIIEFLDFFLIVGDGIETVSLLFLFCHRFNDFDALLDETDASQSEFSTTSPWLLRKSSS